MEKPIERINRELVAKGSITEYYKDTIKDKEGRVSFYDFVKHKGAAAVVPVTKEGKILMVKQYRNALDRFTVEIPAGGLNSASEPMIECARRELEEETGFKSDNLELLISLYTTVAFCNERIDVFVARDLVPSKQNLDEGEYVDVYEYDIEELVSMVYDCTIQDSKTISAIMAYYGKYKA